MNLLFVLNNYNSSLAGSFSASFSAGTPVVGSAVQINNSHFNPFSLKPEQHGLHYTSRLTVSKCCIS